MKWKHTLFIPYSIAFKKSQFTPFSLFMQICDIFPVKTVKQMAMQRKKKLHSWNEILKWCVSFKNTMYYALMMTWIGILERAQRVLISTKHWQMQFNIFHRTYFTPLRLHKIDSISPMCQRCKTTEGSLLHYVMELPGLGWLLEVHHVYCLWYC